MGLRNTASYDMGTLDATNEYTHFIPTSDFQNITLTFITASSANATVKIYASNMEARPTLASAVSATNEYATAQVIDLTDGTVIDWDTGIVWAGTDLLKRVEVNDNFARWVAVKMTARTAGNVTIKADLGDNE